MTLLQIEWPSPPAEIIFSYILDTIRRNRSFRYFPFFTDFIIEADFLEQFMAIANHEGKSVQLDLFSSPSSGVSTGYVGNYALHLNFFDAARYFCHI